jgi:hypothetical protein
MPLYKCWVKATDCETGAPRHSYNWLASRRGWLKVFTDHLECGDWSIPASDVKSATLYELRYGFLPGGSVLVIDTAARTYQFGINPWIRVGDRLPFPFNRERAKLGYSPFSLAVRIALILYVIFFLVRLLNNTP